MAKKLKVYRTSIGFFELAVAAPSMKAAAEAWGVMTDVFSRGFAEQTEDPKAVEAALASPGVVLRRPVGSQDVFSAKAALPKDETVARRPAPRAANSNTKGEIDAKAAEKARRDEAAARAQDEKRRAEAKRRQEAEEAAAREREARRLAEEKRRKEAEEERARKRREQLIAKADASLERAKARHDEAVQALGKRRKELDADEAREAQQWEREQREHAEAIKEARVS